MSEKFIPLSVPNLKGNELKYITKAIEEEWVSTGGEFINNFEKKISDYVKSEGSVACQSGTSGIHLALLATGVEEGDEVIVPTLTFVAAVNPVKYLNANPIFMDCDDTLCIDMEKTKKFCDEECTFKEGKLINNKTGKHIKAIVIVHVFGNMANMEIALYLKDKYNLIIIEDATEALGSYIIKGPLKGKFAGTIGDAGIYSFNGNKIITTGGGGMVVSNNVELLRKIKYLSTQAKDDSLYYIHNEIGFNYRMTNLQAALGLAQLEKIEEFINIKNQMYNSYLQYGIKLIPFREDIRSNKWFYSMITNHRDELMEYLKSQGIQTRPIWNLISELKPYKNAQKYKIERAKHYLNRVINIPCSTNISKSDVQFIASKIIDFEMTLKNKGNKNEL